MRCFKPRPRDQKHLSGMECFWRDVAHQMLPGMGRLFADRVVLLLFALPSVCSTARLCF